MKIILIILSIVQVIGLISSIYLSKSLMLGFKDSIGGILLIAVFWVIYFIFKKYKKSK